MTALQTQNNLVLDIWNDKNSLKQIKEVFAPKSSDLEFQFLVGLGKATGLNPFLREIWSVKYNDSTPAQTFIGRDGYRKAAQAHKDYASHQVDAVFENDDFMVVDGEVKHRYKLGNRGKLLGAYCTVRRKSLDKPMFCFVDFDEYSTGKSLWKSVKEGGKPATMIRKVAEAQGLRMSFQDILGGTYCPEEYEKGIPGAKEDSVVELKNILHINKETGEIIEETIEDKVSKIESLILIKGLSEERLEKALAYYKVTSIHDLDLSQADLFIKQLERV